MKAEEFRIRGVVVVCARYKQSALTAHCATDSTAPYACAVVTTVKNLPRRINESVILELRAFRQAQCISFRDSRRMFLIENVFFKV